MAIATNVSWVKDSPANVLPSPSKYFRDISKWSNLWKDDKDVISNLLPIQNLVLKSLNSSFWSSNEPTTCYIKSLHDPPHFFLSRFFELPVESTGGRRRRLLAQFCDNTNKLVPWWENFHHEKPGIVKVAKTKSEWTLRMVNFYMNLSSFWGYIIFVRAIRSKNEMFGSAVTSSDLTTSTFGSEHVVKLGWLPSLKLTAKAPYQIGRASKRKGSYSNHWNLRGF